MITLKTIDDPINALDGRRILITRYYPKDKQTNNYIPLSSLNINMHMQELSPSHALIQLRKRKEITKDTFLLRFKDELFSELNEDKTRHCLRVLKTMEFMGENICLLQFDKDSHGAIVKDLIEKEKIDVVGKDGVVVKY